MVPADSRRIPRAPRYSGCRCASSRCVYGPVTLYGRSFQSVPLTRCHAVSRSYNPCGAVTPKVWALPRSLATTGGIIVYFLFLQVLRCFSSLRSPPTIGRIPALQAGGLSHSEIRGSRDICSFPRLIAAYHVLHRLREPRHPPCALSYLSYRLRHYVARTVYTFSLYFGFKLCFCHIMSKIVRVVLMIDYVRLRSLRLSSNLHAVENNGFEPLTPCLQSRCSSQLS